MAPVMSNHNDSDSAGKNLAQEVIRECFEVYPPKAMLTEVSTFRVLRSFD